MAITWKEPTDREGNTRPTYAGAVLRTHTNHSVRIMSDVWADMYYADVWTGAAVETISTGNSEFGVSGDAVADATPETLAAVAAWEADKAEIARKEWEAGAPAREAAAKKAEAEAKKKAEREAKAWCNDPQKGDRVVVARRRGRNAPPLGTAGVVFWAGVSGQFGTPRVGFKDDAGETHWTTAGNVDVVRADLEATGGVPAEGWAAYADRLRGERQAAADKELADRKTKAEADLATLPEMGTWVRLKDNHEAIGKVFWRGITKKGAGDARIGFKIRKKDRDAHWAGVGEFDVLTGDPRKRGVPVAALDAVKPDPTNTYAPTPAPIIANPLAHLPPPFDSIVGVDGENEAYDKDGLAVMTLTDETAAHIRGLLEGATGA